MDGNCQDLLNIQQRSSTLCIVENYCRNCCSSHRKNLSWDVGRQHVDLLTVLQNPNHNLNSLTKHMGLNKTQPTDDWSDYDDETQSFPSPELQLLHLPIKKQFNINNKWSIIEKSHLRSSSFNTSSDLAGLGWMAADDDFKICSFIFNIISS